VFDIRYDFIKISSPSLQGILNPPIHPPFVQPQIVSELFPILISDFLFLGLFYLEQETCANAADGKCGCTAILNTFQLHRWSGGLSSGPSVLDLLLSFPFLFFLSPHQLCIFKPSFLKCTQ
jgi:hypothetical protein